jgi:hypothetical protein
VTVAAGTAVTAVAATGMSLGQVASPQTQRDRDQHNELLHDSNSLDEDGFRYLSPP